MTTVSSEHIILRPPLGGGWMGVVLLLTVHAVLETLDSLAEPLHQFRDFLAAEEQEHHQRDDDDFRQM